MKRAFLSIPVVLTLLLCASPLSACLAGGQVGSAEGSGREETLDLLFVGNSLTYTNDLPEMLARLLERGGVKVGRVESKARPNYGLPDHWNSKQTLRAIESGDWDYVIMQQGPSATEGRPYLLDYGARFAKVIREAGATPAFYMVWPSAGRFGDFPGVADSYRTAAFENDAVLLPVGAAWIAAWKRDPKLELYGRDGFHPSRLGTYLATLVMYEQLTGRDPRDLPAAIPGLRRDDPLPLEQARHLQEAAREANAGKIR